MTEASRPIEGDGDLVQYFVDGETEPSEWMVGTEHEKIGLYADTHQRLTYEGERGIAALLERVASEDDWRRVFEAENLVALMKDGASITLEPGGQLELSGAPLRTTRETCAEFNTHVELLKRVSQDMGIIWLGLGHDPIHTIDEIPRMPKARYDIMRSYLPTRGGLALHMMHATATVQANFDYRDEADMASKMRAAMASTPLISALFANSSFSEGKLNGFASRRVDIWRDTDPDRCGILEFVFDPDFGYRNYIEWALDIPMFFIVRGDRYLAANGLKFREFMKSGLAGEQAMLADWDTHLTTLFPEVRLKQIIEVRGADAASRELTCALPAVWKGILYDSNAREATWSLTGGVSAADRDAGLVDVSRRGLAAEYAGRPVLELVRELVAISAEGLAAMVSRGEADPGEDGFLDPLRDVIERGRSPGEDFVSRFEGEWGGSMDRLIESASY
ncbi:MAG: glutamate--cysteine ligase [Deltaproteobacteria bacterium]|nr:glutamate--cysteine ligase [Deltaproteobacteria bacterium]MBW2726109.1 glutamate--cysteine ligase [Deltaproteobacteria bacterium]